jgi:P22 coat protein - gene protein 5
VDFQFTSKDLTLKVEDMSERFLKPAMVQLANDIDLNCMLLYRQVYNWVGTPGQVVNSFADFALAPERLDNNSCPEDKRSAVLAVADYWQMAGSQTPLFPTSISEEAYRRGNVGNVGGVETFQSQNIPTHIVGTKAGSGVAAAGQDSLYDNVKNSTPYGQTLNTTGWIASSAILKAGDIITIGTLGTNGLQAVNSVTKATLPYLKQFVVTADVSSDGAGAAVISISPPIISARLAIPPRSAPCIKQCRAARRSPCWALQAPGTCKTSYSIAMPSPSRSCRWNGPPARSMSRASHTRASAFASSRTMMASTTSATIGWTFSTACARLTAGWRRGFPALHERLKFRGAFRHRQAPHHPGAGLAPPRRAFWSNTYAGHRGKV